MNKQAKNLFLLAIIVSSTIASLFVFPNTASAAAPNLYIAPQATDDAISSAERVSLALCLTNDGGSNLNGGNNPSDTTSASNISTGKWFYDRAEPQTRPGYLVDPDNGQVECRNLFDGHDVAGALGFDSNVELACAVGMKRTNGNNCLDGPGDFTSSGVTKAKVYAAVDGVRANATGGHGFNDIQYYAMAANTYIKACGGAPVVTLAEANADQKNNDNYDQIKIVDFSGAVTTVIYKRDNNGGKAFRNDEGDFHFYNQDCKWMADEMNRRAGAYSTFVKAHQPGKNGTPGTCEEAYTGKSEVEACQAGFAHKGEGEYCETHYPVNPTYSKEANACLYGQNTATAAAGTTEAPAQPGADEPQGKSSCTVEGIGWIICPVVNFMAKIVDGAYGFVASLLVVQPLLVTGSSTDIYSAWSVMRNFANVAFVIAFLLIIFSQLTSVGITNYGIKKMLPRLIVAAILVNVSYWVCAICVDLSNIVGGSINDVLKGIGNNSIVAGPSAEDFGASGNGWEGIAGAILAGGIVAAAVFYATLSALIPALIAALLAIVTVFLVLTIRQAIIILLIVISPLAFVAYLLPNTESMFKKWRDLFKTLLLMYPIIAAIFGASALASTVVMNSASGTYKIAIQLMGALISIIPLALTPIVMKTAGSLLGRIGGNINNPNKGPIDKLRKKGDNFAERRAAIANTRRIDRAKGVINGEGGMLGENGTRRRRTAAWMAGAGVTSGINGQQKDANAKKALATAEQNYVATRVAGSAGAESGANARYLQNITGPTGNASKVEAAAIAVQKRSLQEAIENATISADIEPGSAGIDEMGRRLERAVMAGDTVTAQAMQNMLLKGGSSGISKYRETLEGLEGRRTEAGKDTMDNATMTDMRQNILANHSSVKAAAGDIMQQAIQGGNISERAKESDTWKLSDAEMATQKSASMKLALTAKKSDGSFAVSGAQAKRILASPELSKSIASDDIRDALIARAATAPSTPAPAPSPTPPSPPPPPSSPGPGPTVP